MWHILLPFCSHNYCINKCTGSWSDLAIRLLQWHSTKIRPNGPSSLDHSHWILGLPRTSVNTLRACQIVQLLSYKGWKETREIIRISVQQLLIIFPSINWWLARCICFPGYLKRFFLMHDDLSPLLKIQAEIALWNCLKTMQSLVRIIIYNDQQYQQGVWKEDSEIYTELLSSWILTASSGFQVLNSYRKDVL